MSVSFWPLLDRIPRVAGRIGRPRHKPRRLYADRGYDYPIHRRRLTSRGIPHSIARRGHPHGSGLGEIRYVVERSFAWLHATVASPPATNAAPTSTTHSSASAASSSAGDTSNAHLRPTLSSA